MTSPVDGFDGEDDDDSGTRDDSEVMTGTSVREMSEIDGENRA